MFDMSNETFKVATLFECPENGFHFENIGDDYKYNTLWRQTVLGCDIMGLLQEVHGFSVNYVFQKQDVDRDVTAEIQMYWNTSAVDFYVRPMSLRPDVMEMVDPVAAIFDWNFGFTISHPDVIYHNFYSKPFSRRVWNILYTMVFLCSIFFYLLKRWENKLRPGREGECSYFYELLMVFGAHFQHIPPIDAHILSRRTAYLVFFVFAYIIYTYYTSNLLSHLVNDKNLGMPLDELLDSDIDCVILDSVKSILHYNLANIYSRENLSTTYQKLLSLRSVSMEEGLAGIKTTKTALLADYFSIDPYLETVFSSNEICNLAQTDVVSNIRKYFYVSQAFPYLEEFKITLFRAREAGLLNRLILLNYHAAMPCTPAAHVETKLEQIVLPLAILLGAYVLCLVIVVIEIIHHKRNKVWPYVN